MLKTKNKNLKKRVVMKTIKIRKAIYIVCLKKILEKKLKNHAKNIFSGLPFTANASVKIWVKNGNTASLNKSQRKIVRVGSNKPDRNMAVGLKKFLPDGIIK